MYLLSKHYIVTSLYNAHILKLMLNRRNLVHGVNVNKAVRHQRKHWFENVLINLLMFK